MSKITFRADSDLVDAVESLDASKSEVMRDALRAYLEQTTGVASSSVEEFVRAHGETGPDHRPGTPDATTHDVNVRVLVESAEDSGTVDREFSVDGDAGRPPRGRRGRGQSCSQCGNSLSSDHVYCPSCGEKATNRVFCECGDEVRADWAFCPHCGRRTASAEAFDR